MGLNRLLRVGFTVAGVSVWLIGTQTPEAIADPAFGIKSDLVSEVEGQGDTQVTLSLAVTNNDSDPLTGVSLTLVSPADLTTSFGAVSLGTLAPGMAATASGTFTIPQQDLLLMGDLEVQNFKISFTNVFLDELNAVVKSEKMPEQTGP